MDADRTETLRGQILEKIEILKADIGSYESITRPVAPDNAIGRLSRMEALNSKSINEAALRTARASLEKLKRALTMLDDPDFGFCRECEEPIPFARLMIVPEALFCVQCAEKMGA